MRRSTVNARVSYRKVALYFNVYKGWSLLRRPAPVTPVFVVAAFRRAVDDLAYPHPSRAKALDWRLGGAVLRCLSQTPGRAAFLSPRTHSEKTCHETCHS